MSKRRNVSGRIFVIGVLAFLCLLVGIISYVKFWPRPEPVAPKPVTVEDIRIGNVGEYSIFNLIAERQGIFTKNGLRATVKEYPSGPAGLSVLLSGNEDIQIASDFAGVLALFENSNLRAISQASRHFTFSVVARKDHGITSPADLRGKKIGVAKKTASEFFLGRFLATNLLKPEDVTILDIPPAEIDSRLTSGELDAAVVFEPHGYTLRTLLGDQAIMWSAQGDQATFAVIWTTDTFARNHPETLTRYLQSLKEAQEFLEAHPDDAARILADAMHYDPAYVAYVWPKFTFGLGFAQELMITMESQARWIMQTRLTAETVVPNYLDFMQFGPLEAVDPDSITLVH